MKRFSFFLIVGLAALLAACNIYTENQFVGSGNVITQTRTVSGFVNLELNCSADVSLTQGDPLTVSIEGEDNIIPLIETKVSERKLVIDVKPNTSFRTTKPLIVHIVAPRLLSIRVRGSGDVEVKKLMSDSLELTTTGSGGISVNSLDTPILTARISGSGDIIIKGGGGGSQSITNSGSGDYKSFMTSREVDATTSGSGNIVVWVAKTLSAHISGSGDIQYYGSPAVDKRDTGSGSVERRGDKP